MDLTAEATESRSGFFPGSCTRRCQENLWIWLHWQSALGAPLCLVAMVEHSRSHSRTSCAVEESRRASGTSQGVKKCLRYHPCQSRYMVEDHEVERMEFSPLIGFLLISYFCLSCTMPVCFICYCVIKTQGGSWL